ncbi:MAG: FAD-dependent oxidoreductase [Pseudomonadales bacterium]|nr:FAD-dependent oxidoreductase [Pseudomonadales bacterium]
MPLLASSKARVGIVGGGFGGATLARYLVRQAGVSVTLIDPVSAFITCPFSNLVLTGAKTLSEITFSRRGLIRDGVEFIPLGVTGIDAARRELTLSDGSKDRFDFLVCAPGVEMNYESVAGADSAIASHGSGHISQRMPHAWKAGDQTQLLAAQLGAMRPGGTFLITAPPNPFRCPPGPYERAGLVAEWMTHHNPAGKVLIVDQKDSFTKMPLFLEGWRKRYGDRVEWIGLSQTGELREVIDGGKADKSGKRGIRTDFDEFRADVVNLIPPQRAPSVLRDAGLDEGRGWCPVHPDSFESRVASNVFIIGDAASAAPMPKSAFSANNQAKLVAAVIAARVNGQSAPTAWLVNTCYSLVASDYGISVSGTYRARDDMLIQTGGGQSPTGADEQVHQLEATYTHGWYESITRDSFGGAA